MLLLRPFTIPASSRKWEAFLEIFLELREILKVIREPTGRLEPGIQIIWTLCLGMRLAGLIRFYFSTILYS
jgi:hypothetical protein